MCDENVVFGRTGVRCNYNKAYSDKMEKWKPLNMELRSWVISRVLRLEQTSSSLLRAILRMFKENPKTLGNQTSALSFRSKIDLLYDIEEIDSSEYNHLLKMMEIRNQFAHNPNAVSFESLDEINPAINKYLEKLEFDGIDKYEKREVKLKFIFSEMFKRCEGKLLVTEIEYTKGLEKDIRKHINDAVVDNLDEIWADAVKRHLTSDLSTPSLFFMNGPEKQIENFYLDFRIAMGEFSQNELSKIEGENLMKVFKQKETITKMKKNKKEKLPPTFSRIAVNERK